MIVSNGKVLTVKEAFENAGVTFGEGASAKFLFDSEELTITNTVEQLESVQAFFDSVLCCGSERQILVVVEWIEMEDSLYHDWMFRNRFTGDGTALRNEVQDWVKTGDASIIETSVVMARSGQRARTESVRELVFPSEFRPPEIPNELHLEGKHTVAPVTSVPITAFEDRNVGSSMNVDAVLGADEWSIDLNLSPEMAVESGSTRWPTTGRGGEFVSISQPRFHTMKIATQVIVVDGRVGFLGTTRPQRASVEGRKRPIVLQFVRGDISRLSREKGRATHIERIK